MRLPLTRSSFDPPNYGAAAELQFFEYFGRSSKQNSAAPGERLGSLQAVASISQGLDDPHCLRAIR
jgi:hypothetical protein